MLGLGVELGGMYSNLKYSPNSELGLIRNIK